MSYVRWSKHSDVYVYCDIDFGLRCLFAPTWQEDARGLTAEQMIVHLRKHQARGDLVPEYAIDALRKEVGVDFGGFGPRDDLPPEGST